MAQEGPPPEVYDETHLHQLRLDFDAPNWSEVIGTEADLPARLDYDGRIFPRIGARYKGRSTLNVSGPKKPFNLTLDAFVEGQAIEGYDTINLDNGYLDPSHLREVLSYGLMREFMPAPQAAFGRVDLQGDYVGLYSLVQQVDRSFLREWYPTDEGDLFKAEPYSDESFFQYRPTLAWEGEDLEEYRRRYELKGPTRTQAGRDAAYTRLRELTRLLDAPISSGGVSSADFPAAIRERLDVDAALWYLAAQNLLCNFDSYYFGHNYLLFFAESDQRYHILPWDLNLSLWGYPAAFFGPTRPDQLVRAEPLIASQDASLPLIRRLLSVPSFRADYLAHYRVLRDRGLEPGRIEARVEAHAHLIRDSLREEPSSLHGFELFERNLREDVSLQLGGFLGRRVVPGILSLTGARYAWLREPERGIDLAEPDLHLAERSQDPLEPSHAEEVRVRIHFTGSEPARFVSLVYRVDGGPPRMLSMLRDGEAWSVSIPAQPPRSRVRYYLRAELADGRAQFHPAANLTEAWGYRSASIELPRLPEGALVINELQAANQSGPIDDEGESDDWIELYNRGESALDLEGYFLSDDPRSPWSFPLDGQLAAGEHRLIWADGRPSQGPDHSRFKLNRAGESLLLARRDGIVDLVEFPAQETDLSYGRSRDGAADWQVCRRPSPAGTNRCLGGAGAAIFLPFTGQQLAGGLDP